MTSRSFIVAHGRLRPTKRKATGKRFDRRVRQIEKSVAAVVVRRLSIMNIRVSRIFVRLLVGITMDVLSDQLPRVMENLLAQKRLQRHAKRKPDAALIQRGIRLTRVIKKKKLKEEYSQTEIDALQRVRTMVTTVMPDDDEALAVVDRTLTIHRE